MLLITCFYEIEMQMNITICLVTLIVFFKLQKIEVELQNKTKHNDDLHIIECLICIT